jgi:hypothetical protein
VNEVLDRVIQQIKQKQIEDSFRKNNRLPVDMIDSVN